MGFRDRIRQKLGRQSTPDSSASSRPDPTVVSTTGLWDVAWERFLAEHNEDAKNFQRYIEHSIPHDDGKSDGNISAAQRIAESISTSIDEYQTGHETSQRIKKSLKQILDFAQKGSKIIEVAASSHPIAASVWAGVSAIIPILLEPGNQSAAATEILSESIELLQCCHSYERILQGEDDRDSVRLVRGKIVDVYYTVLLFEAKFVNYRDKSGTRRFMHDLVTDWTATSKELKSTNSAFKERVELLRFDWQQKEQERRRIQEEREQTSKVIADLYVNARPSKGKRLPGTCEWFLRRPEFTSWKLDSFGLLWVTADPGCGKSVLIKYLVDSRIELLDSQQDDSITAFFFFSGGQAFSTASAALCSLMHQILLEAPQKATVVDKYCNSKGMKVESLRSSSVEIVWAVLLQVVAAVSVNRNVICVLDALDECDTQSLGTLIEQLEDLYKLGKTSNSSLRLRFLVTSRPYEELRVGLRQSVKIKPDVRIDAADEQDAIKEEINIVIQQRVEELAKDKDLTPASQAELLSALQSAEHRTYLWLYLVCERFQREWIDASSTISDFVGTLPQSVEEEYGRILERMRPSYQSNARKIFEVILAAFEPLTAAAIYHAMRIDASTASVSDLSTGTNRSVVDVVRDICGLFIVVDREDRVYLLHQTARDYLLHQPDEYSFQQTVSLHGSTDTSWRYSLRLSACHLRLGEACLRYLFLPDFQKRSEEYLCVCYSRPGNVPLEIKPRGDNGDLLQQYPLLAYTPNFLIHLSAVYTDVSVPDHLCALIFRLRRPFFFVHLFTNVRPFESTWILRMSTLSDQRACPSVYLAAAFGLTSVLAYGYHKGADLFEIVNNIAVFDIAFPSRLVTNSIPINEAIRRRDVDSVELLLENLSTDHAVFNDLRIGKVPNPLCVAASVSLDMFKRIQGRPEFSIELADRSPRPLLISAISSQDIEVVRKVIELGADTSLCDEDGFQPLAHAARPLNVHFNDEFFGKLVEVMASEVDVIDDQGVSPLAVSWAFGHQKAAELLLKHGAKYTRRSRRDRNMLHASASSKHGELEGNIHAIPQEDLRAMIRTRDESGDYPFDLAIKSGNFKLAAQLLETSYVDKQAALDLVEAELQVHSQSSGDPHTYEQCVSLMKSLKE